MKSDFMRRKLLGVVGYLFIALGLLQFALAFQGREASHYLGAPGWALAILEQGGLKLWLVTFGAVVSSVAIGLYALSGAGVVGRLPGLRPVLFVVGGGLAVWGLGVLKLLALYLRQPGTLAPRLLVIRGVPLVLGLVCLWAAAAVRARSASPAAPEAAPPGGPAERVGQAGADDGRRDS
jgi:hypothetical protein